MNVQRLIKVGAIVSVFCDETTITGNCADGYYPCKVLAIYDGKAGLVNLETAKIHTRYVFDIKNVYAWYTKQNWKVLCTTHGNWIESRNRNIGFTVLSPYRVSYDTVKDVPIYITTKVAQLASKGIIE